MFRLTPLSLSLSFIGRNNFQLGTEARNNGGFIRRYSVKTSVNRNVKLMRIFFVIKLIKHTEQLLEHKEDTFCIQVLNNLRQMMNFDVYQDDKVFQILLKLIDCAIKLNLSLKQGDGLRTNLFEWYFA